MGGLQLILILNQGMVGAIRRRAVALRRHAIS
jgi:hypothetical protein